MKKTILGIIIIWHAFCSKFATFHDFEKNHVFLFETRNS